MVALSMRSMLPRWGDGIYTLRPSDAPSSASTMLPSHTAMILRHARSLPLRDQSEIVERERENSVVTQRIMRLMLDRRKPLQRNAPSA